MEGYHRVFTHASETFHGVDNKEELFKSFRKNRAIYGFIDNGDTPPDMEADSIARRTNYKMYSDYKELLRYRKIIGYGDSTPLYGDYSNLDSRHIMMFVILFSNLKEPVDSVVEIGGGFGNWLTLNQHIPHWTIVDLPHVSELQKWWFDQQEVDPSKYKLITSDNCTKDTFDKIDLVIGSHSMSEFALEIFVRYFHDIVLKSKYFFYAYHNTLPNPTLIKTKLGIILHKFDLVTSVTSENGNVSNCLFIRKTE